MYKYVHTHSCPGPQEHSRALFLNRLCKVRWWAFFWRGQGASTAQCFRICPHYSFFPLPTLSPGMLQIPTAWFSLTYILVVVELLSHVQLCGSLWLQPASLPGHGIPQARILEPVAIPFSRGSSQPGARIHVSCVSRWILPLWATREAQLTTYSCCCHLVAQSCLTLCDPVDWDTPGFPIFHHLLVLAQTHVHWISDAIQPCHLLSPTPSSSCLQSFSASGSFPGSQFFASGAKVLALPHQSFQWPSQIQLLILTSVPLLMLFLLHWSPFFSN